MDVFRASRRERAVFDPLDSSASIARDGWRFNDRRTEILYAAGVEALATLEVTARPGWHLVKALTIATIEAPDGSVVDLSTVGITLPSNLERQTRGKKRPVDRTRVPGRCRQVHRSGAAGLRRRRAFGGKRNRHERAARSAPEGQVPRELRARIPFDWLVDTAR